MKRFRWIALCVAICLLLGGCVTDIDSLLVPPTPAGEQQAIRQALDSYVMATYNMGYTLRYPAGGDYTAAYILYPENDRALAFYSVVGDASGNIHANLLAKADDGWHSIGDAEEMNTGVEKVSFADLDGDGASEALVGWNVYNSTDCSLHCYAERDGRPTVQTVSGVYTEMIATDMTGDGIKDLILLRYSSEGRNSARLFRMHDKMLMEQGNTRIDGYVRRILQWMPQRLSDEMSGVYLDVETGGDSRTTELLLWNGNTFSAPFYSVEDNRSVTAARRMELLCTADKDGLVRYPVMQLLDGFDAETAPSYGWLTSWTGFNQPDSEPILRLYVEEADAAVRVDEEWGFDLSVTYDETAGAVTLWRGKKAALAVSFGETLPEDFTQWYRTADKTVGVWADTDVLGGVSWRTLLIRREEDAL